MRRRVLLIALLLGCLGWFAWLMLSGPREPAYQGHVLSYWLQHYYILPANIPSSGMVLQPNSQAVEAIRHIGTNAIPTLLRQARAHDSTLKLKLLALAKKQNLIGIRFASSSLIGSAGPLAKRKQLIDIRLTPAPERNLQASHGFRELGSAASNAVPALIAIYDANISPASQDAALVALGAIGPTAKPALPSLLRTLADTNNYARLACVRALASIHAELGLVVPALVKSLSDPHFGVRMLAAEALGQFGADAQPAVPALVEIYDRNTVDSLQAATTLGLIGPAARLAVPSLSRGLTNANLELRRLSILSLGRIHAVPQLVVPALIRCLGDTGANIQFFSIMALGQYGPEATSALPALTNLLLDPNPNIRLEVTNALRCINVAAEDGMK
ncbi:MAG: HEAT repeat domain-containing protein [Verrucomicrobia bacterium]|nr:HEAT repeat domain-containing protein [Verrucomicrobiota bacterium]